MKKIASYKGTLMSLILLEEKIAQRNGLQVWQCSCGSKFMTVYYASFHCEKQHKGEKFKDRIKLRKNFPTNTKQWNVLYTSVSDIVVKTITPEISASNIVDDQETFETRDCFKHHITKPTKSGRENGDRFILHAVKTEREQILNSDEEPRAKIPKWSPDKGIKTSEPRISKRVTSGFQAWLERTRQNIVTSQNSKRKTDNLLPREITHIQPVLEDDLVLGPPAVYLKKRHSRVPANEHNMINHRFTVKTGPAKNKRNKESKKKTLRKNKNVQPFSDDNMDMVATADSMTSAIWEQFAKFSNNSAQYQKNVATLQHIDLLSSIPETRLHSQILFNAPKRVPLMSVPIPLQSTIPPIMTMNLELPYPIPDPAHYPYPDFTLVEEYTSLYQSDDTPTTLLWQKRAEYYTELTEQNLDPWIAQFLWTRKNDQAI